MPGGWQALGKAVLGPVCQQPCSAGWDSACLLTPALCAAFAPDFFGSIALICFFFPPFFKSQYLFRFLSALFTVLKRSARIYVLRGWDSREEALIYWRQGLTAYPRLALNLQQFSCLGLLNAEIIDICHHARRRILYPFYCALLRSCTWK